MNFQSISLHLITVSHNPRNPARRLLVNLPGEAYKGEQYNPETTPLELARRLALSDDPADRAEYVRLLELYEWKSPADGIINPESLVALAESLRKKQIEPIMVRDFRSKGSDGEYHTRYGIVVGERRFLATCYLFAKYGEPNAIIASIASMTLAQAGDLAWEENRRRANMTDMEVARYFHAQVQESKGKVNPTTGRKVTVASIRRNSQPFIGSVSGSHPIECH